MLNKHFQEFTRLLEKHGVEYLIVGGYAVGFHGFPRYTGDMDVFVGISEANSRKIIQVFSDFGFADLGLTEADFLEEEIVVEIGREPMKIQVLTGIDGVTFEECLVDRVFLQLQEDLCVPFIGIDSLLRNKKSSPRAKDRIDFEELRRIKE